VLSLQRFRSLKNQQQKTFSNLVGKMDQNGGNPLI